jgi:hypothetical protein
MKIKIGDLVQLKSHCRRFDEDDRVYLVSGRNGGFLRLHGEHGLISSNNFILVSKTDETR